ncbi:unnamed protein product [Paramecium pentaurelia]|uniref:Uncharacterized protein n=1 Tax=Paramecium pentaurelia TaxID=43138 RepID=A0A8S1UZ88_9CILI|nr:unnamed protein product [Paramecium pentaurelia]
MLILIRQLEQQVIPLKLQLFIEFHQLINELLQLFYYDMRMKRPKDTAVFLIHNK